MTSVLPPPIANPLRKGGFTIPRGARGFALGASIAVAVVSVALAAAGAPVRAEGAPAPSRRSFPAILPTEGFPSSLVPKAQRITDLINSGDEAAMARIDGTGGHLKAFWSSYAEFGTIVFRAVHDEPAGGFALYDATSGMFSCQVEPRRGRWIVTRCVFNDGY